VQRARFLRTRPSTNGKKTVIKTIIISLSSGSTVGSIPWTVLLLLVVMQPAITAAAEQELRVYAEANAVDSRVIETSDGSRVEGYASELVRAVLADAGYTANIQVVPWPRLMSLLGTEANVLGFNMTRTPEREDRFHWFGEIRPVNFQLWGLRDRLDELPRTLEAARDLRISAFRDDVVEQYLLARGFSNLVYVTDSSDTWGMLSRRRIDLIPYIQSGAENFMSRLADARDSLVPVIALEEISTAHYLVMSKNSDAALVLQLQQAYERLEDSGAYERILGPSLQRSPTQ